MFGIVALYGKETEKIQNEQYAHLDYPKARQGKRHPKCTCKTPASTAFQNHCWSESIGHFHPALQSVEPNGSVTEQGHLVIYGPILEIRPNLHLDIKVIF